MEIKKANEFLFLLVFVRKIDYLRIFFFRYGDFVFIILCVRVCCVCCFLLTECVNDEGMGE